MIKAVLFDLDDTLLKTIEAKWEHHKAVASDVYGIELQDETLRQHWGKPLTVLVGELYQHSDTVENMVKANRELDEKFPKDVFDDAVDTVTALLDDGILVGVITSTLTNWARRDLERHDFPVDRFFILQGEDVHHATKPDPAVFDPAFDELEARGIDFDDVVYVGDSLVDNAAAGDAGIRFVGVATGLIKEVELEAAGATYVARKISDILKFVEDENGK